MGTNVVDVECANGRLRGNRANGAVCFKGIPYAASTGGRNRFMAPQPVANWSGVREAFNFGDRCTQERETYGDAPILSWYAQSEALSEDCCVLNVYSPNADGAHRPVMVYIHGGGYITGGGGGAVLDGANLAKFGDVVVVTVNHRLNVFGYTNLGQFGDEAFGDAANAGQLDLVAALTWVRDNIAAFGGDPSCVTLFGQSGGGSKIMVLMGMPQARGLFHRAINMSGTSGTTVAPAQATQPYVNEFLRNLGIHSGNLRELQKLPADALIRARLAAVALAREGARPVIDGRHIHSGAMSSDGLAIHASIPLLMGTTMTESTFFFASDKRHLSLTERQVAERLKAQFGGDDAHAAAIMDTFRQETPDRSPSEVLVALISDTLFRVPILRAAEAKANAGAAPVYLYNFTWKSPADGGVWGAPHAMDIPFAFGNTAKALSITCGAAEADEVSCHMMTAFVAFARSGDPNNARMPAWKPYEPQHRATMTIGTTCALVNDFLGRDRLAASQLQLDPFNRQALFTYRE